MGKNVSNDKKQENSPRITEEISDLEERLNEVELQLVDAKEFSHISSDAFQALQEQIAELREMFEHLLLIKSNPEQKSTNPISEYF